MSRDPLTGNGTRRAGWRLHKPGLAGDVFGVLAEGLVGAGARGHGAGRGAGEGGRRGFGDLLAQVADPLFLLVLGQGQEQHVPR